MKKKSLIIDEKTRKRNKFITKLIITIALLVVCIVTIVYIIGIYKANEEFSNYVDGLTRLNSKTVFSIDRIYLYSSADATSNETTKPVWDLNLFQFTDIALYINNRSEEGVTYENTIKELTIDNVKFNDLQSGTPSLYYKNVNDFAKLTNLEENKINDSLEFKVVNSGEADYSEPTIYSNCQNPITLEYVNTNMEENTIISDISTPLTYDGSLLRKGGILISQMECTLSFTITIINNYNQKYVATVYIDIPIEDNMSGASIYDGKIIKNIENTNLVKFIRVE